MIVLITTSNIIINFDQEPKITIICISNSLPESTEAPLDNSIHDLAIPDKVHEAIFCFLLLFVLTIPDKVHEAF